MKFFEIKKITRGKQQIMLAQFNSTSTLAEFRSYDEEQS